MTDRDTFAAAALTGLIANGDYSVESTPLLAYRMADAMLRERGDFRVSQNANEPMAWWLKGSEYDTGCEYEYVSLVKESADAAAKEGGTVTPLYRAPTLTDEERAAVERVCVAYELLPTAGAKQVADTLSKLLERTK